MQAKDTCASMHQEELGEGQHDRVSSRKKCCENQKWQMCTKQGEIHQIIHSSH